MNFYDGKKIEFTYICDNCQNELCVTYNFACPLHSELKVFLILDDDKHVYPYISIVESCPEKKRINVNFSFYCKKCNQRILLNNMEFELKDDIFHPIVAV